MRWLSDDGDEEDIISLGGTPPPPAAASPEQPSIEEQQDDNAIPPEPALETADEMNANNAKTLPEPEPKSSSSEQEKTVKESQDALTDKKTKPDEAVEKVPRLTRDRLNNILERRSAEATLLAESVSCIEHGLFNS